MAKYTKLKITANTLVEKGAVQEEAIYKELDGKIKTTTKSLEIRKNDSKMEIESVMYLLNKVDSHGDWVEDPKVLDEAALDFMQNGSKVIKHTHNGKEIEAYVKEIYIVPKGHPVWKEDRFIGALVNVIKFKDEELYNFYKENNYQTSIEGFVETADEPKLDEESIVAKVYNKIKNLLKSGEPTMTNKAEGDVLVLNQSLIDISKSEKSFEDKLNDLKLLLAKYEMPAEAPETVEDSTQKVDEVVSPLMMEAIKTAVNEALTPISSKYDELKSIVDSKYDELKSMIDASSGTIANISETAKSYDEKIREIRKDFLLEKENQETPVVKPTYKSPLS